MRRLAWPLIGLVSLAALTYAADGPLTNGANILVRTDGNGYLLMAAQTYSGSDGPMRTFANTLVRTDANGYLIVTNPTGIGAPTNAYYWLGTSNSSLTNGVSLGALSTAIVVNTAGVPSAYAGSTCTNQFLRVLSAVGAGTCASVSLTADVSGDLPYSSLAQGSALSVLGVGGNSTADVASLVASSDGNVLRRSGTAVGFGQLNLASTNGVTGTLPDGNLSANVAFLNAANTFINGSGQTINGLLTLSSGGAGQILFPATQHATSQANTLDDYEEGTWTPSIQFGGASVGQTYVVNPGRYTKIGNRVVVFGRVLLSAKGSSTGNAKLAGLPFTSDSTSGNAPPAAIWANNLAVTVANPMATITQNSTVVDLYTFATGSITGLDDTYFNNNSDISFSVTYEAAQ